MTLSLWRGVAGLTAATLIAVGACAQGDATQPDETVLDPQGQGGAGGPGGSGAGDAGTGGGDAGQGDGGDSGAAGGTGGPGGSAGSAGAPGGAAGTAGGGGAAGGAGAKAGASGAAGGSGGTSGGAGISGGSGQGGAGAAGTAGAGTAGTGTAGTGETGGAPPKTIDPALRLPPQSAAGCKTEGKTGGDCDNAFLVCRIYNQSEGRCEGCSPCNGIGTACTASVQCAVTAQCYGGFCRELCQLESKLCKNGGKCQDVGNESAGVCVP